MKSMIIPHCRSYQYVFSKHIDRHQLCFVEEMVEIVVRTEEDLSAGIG